LWEVKNINQAINTCITALNNIVQGENNKFEDGVLYKDIDGRKGHCYYARHDQDVRLWFLDYKIIAIYMTRSDYGS